ncbi:MAG TPA: hypothetical protein VFH58_16285 [Acidimicrobiales bacterium]|nr:hypothetical protein [Acidimicrobiales bacterium]
MLRRAEPRSSRAAGLLAGLLASASISLVSAGAGGGPAAAATPSTPPQGYWLMTTSGQVLGYGGVAAESSPAINQLARPMVCMSSTADGGGYWTVASDGGVFSFGDASFHGSLGGLHLNQPVVGMAPTPSGAGYWLVASDGGIFAFGDARFHGSLGGVRLNQPVVGMAPTPSGAGYWLVASDGGIFAFGDARFHGSLGGVRLTQPVVGMAPTPSGEGYWLAARDGGVFTFGDGHFYGSAGGSPPAAPVVAVDRPGIAGGCQGTATPAPITPPGPGGPAGEGQWSPFARSVGSTTAAYSTVLRPSTGIPAASVVWIDTSRTRFRQYAGSVGEPPGSYRYSTAVTGADLTSLVAAFNGGFKTADSRGGWYSEGQMPYPVVNGAASLVTDSYGQPRIGMWGRDFTSLAGVASVRQNLGLLVDHGAPAPDINTGGDWGAVIGGVGNTCRSGIGTDRYGNLLYAAGPVLYPIDLAHVLIRAGAVEAMELDINCQWPILSGFVAPTGQAASAANAVNVAPWMHYPPTQFIAGSSRDFVAVFSR